MCGNQEFWIIYSASRKNKNIMYVVSLGHAQTDLPQIKRSHAQPTREGHTPDGSHYRSSKPRSDGSQYRSRKPLLDGSEYR
jgi:hypothetical protein